MPLGHALQFHAIIAPFACHAADVARSLSLVFPRIRAVGKVYQPFHATGPLACHPRQGVLGSLCGEEIRRVGERKPSVLWKSHVVLASGLMDCCNHTRARTACWRLIAAFFCGVLAFAWSESAEATCGDWLSSHGMAEASSPEKPVGSTETASLNAPSAGVATRPSGQRPCNGPACSRRPDLPMSPSGPGEPITPTSRLQAVVTHGDAPPVPAASWLAIDEPLSWANGPTSRIERPPMRG